MISKEREIIDMYDDWIRLKQSGLSLKLYMDKYSINSIAIYGMNKLGYTLLDELIQCDIDVKYGVDKVLAGKYNGIPVYGPDDLWDKVDAVIVSAFPFFEEIYPVIQAKLPDAKIIPLDVMIKRILIECRQVKK